METDRLEVKLAGQSYAKIADALGGEDSRALLRLLDSRSRKIGDTAADFLAIRREADMLLNVVLGKGLSTATGKVRALSVLRSFGKSCPRALDAYLSMLTEKSFRVVDWALFGIVFMQEPRAIPEIQAALRNVEADSKTAERLQCALKAIETGNPYLYSPDFLDSANLWGTKE